MQTIEHQLLTKTQHELAYDVAYEGCFQWFKDTKMKANHNEMQNAKTTNALFPMVQRY